ncbi:MAG: MBL fold metallo-hydrolase [Acidobacteria bacterium]|nr:MBL fold metallo-hydrolase [Acidobacteriota bacterium]
MKAPILAVLILCFLSVGTGAQVKPTSGTQIVLLGTGNPNPDPNRWGPATAIVINGAAYIVDAGSGVVRRAQAAFEKGISALATPRLRISFITHLHSDHTLGYPDLILTPAIQGRNGPLEVYGPKGLSSMTDNILKAYAEDISVRVNGLEKGNPAAYRVNVHEIKPGVIYKDENVTVTAFLVQHATWEQAFGYKFETKDRTIVISGDCVPSQSVIDACNGCDVLIHEVYSQAGFLKRPEQWQKYHASAHTSSYQLADLAAKAKPKLLVLYHQLVWSSTFEDLLQEVQERYKGKVVNGNDLDVY